MGWMTRHGIGGDMENIPLRFKFTSFKANPRKFQFSILGNKNHYKYSLSVRSITIKVSNEAE